jgi:GT2 family glycosyltransferase
MTAHVTVAIPVYNGARFLRETLQSLKRQTLAAAEIAVLDDASTDDSIAIAREESVDVIPSATRGGLAANWNRALEHCRTPYLVIAHQDDAYEASYLETMLAALERHPGALAAHCRARAIDENGAPIADPAARFKDRFWSGEAEIERDASTELELLRQGNYVVAPTAMLRMSASRAVGPFAERYQFVTDWEYWLRALAAGFTLVGVRERLVRFRRHAGTATKASESTMRRYEEELELLRDLDGRVPSKHAYRAVQRNLLAGFVSRLSSGDRGGASAMIRFGEERVPHFRYATLMRFALRGGRPAGRVLALARDLYIRTADQVRA